MVKDKRSEIQNIYDKFYEEFYSEKHRAIRDALKKISLKKFVFIKKHGNHTVLLQPGFYGEI